MEQSHGKIFLADDRGLTETNLERRYSTFNFAGYYNEHKQGSGNLYTFNDEMLAAGASVQQQVRFGGYMIILPVTGAVQITIGAQTHEADAGEVLLLPIVENEVFTLTNPYPENWVNFIVMQIKADAATLASAQNFAFDIDGNPDSLVAAVDNDALPFALHIGRFAGRTEAVYNLKDEQSQVFAFVIAGAFELQNRLLHERDGLALWHTQQVEVEALSNNAVLLLMELK
ncbi:hypothetical protein GCM10023149_44010 [Mucilaginibacter gynuensis]|uniref:Quercetin 2,3-dioxygenase C-terminal cupin domain-containing protein n=1 Tax=Mucilaginibacter gynuensis TaxID=1302236 RepID=A0ABP8H8B2_9SPHI